MTIGPRVWRGPSLLDPAPDPFDFDHRDAPERHLLEALWRGVVRLPDEAAP